MKTNEIILPVAAFALGAFMAKKNEIFSVGRAVGKVTIVKKWWGISNDDSKATYKEFKTKKEAQKYIDLERRFNAMQGNQFSGASNFYEII